MIYLDKIRIDNFRSIGSLEIDRLPRRGVLILTGCNGLGKTTFFEAIEWALLGAVERIQAHKGKGTLDPYGRIRADGSTCTDYGVDLEFVDTEAASRVHWSRRSGVAASAPDVARLLQAITRKDVVVDPARLAWYLALTHYLPQSKLQQFTLQTGTDRWERLQGPAGLEQVAMMRSKLSPKEVAIALKERVGKAALAVTAKRDQVKQWDELRLRRRELEAAVAAGGGQEPTSVRAALTEVAREVGAPRLRRSADDAEPSATLTALGQLRQWIVEERESITLKEAELAALEMIPLAWAERSRDMTAIREEIGIATAALDAARSAVQADADHVSAREEAERQAKAATEAAVRESERIQALGEAWRRLRGCRQEIPVVEAQLTEAKEEQARCEQLLQQQQARLADWEDIAGRLAKAKEARTRVHGVLTALESWVDRDAQWRAGRAKFEASRAELANLREEEASNQAAQVNLRDETARLDERIADQRKALDVQTRAIADLAAFIGDTSHQCPLCSSEFPTDGVLLSKVQEAVTRASSVLAPLIARRQAVSDELAGLDQSNKGIASRVRVLASAVRDAEDQQSRLAREWSRLRSDPELLAQPEDASPAQCLAHLQARVAEFDALRASLLAELTERGDRTDLDGRVTVARGASRAAQAATEGVQKRLLDLRKVVQVSEGVLNASSKITSRWASEEDVSQTAAASLKAVESAEDQLRRLKTEVQAGVAVTAQLREAQIAKQRSMGDLAARRQDAEKAVAGLHSRWNAAGLPGDPDRTVLLDRAQHFRARGLQLEQSIGRLSRLLEQLNAWRSAEELRACDARIATACEEGRREKDMHPLSPDQLRTRLMEDLAGLEAEEARTKSAIDKLQRVIVALREEESAFADSVLAPLNDRLSSFLGALSPDLDWVVEDRLRRTAGRSQIESMVFWNRSKKEAGRGMLQMLSEGQLAAVSLAQILSLSTAYQWSRWPCLLLDDPVQFNDVIHIASFIDLVRNLVMDKHYQVMLSTHDGELADYFERKLSAMGVQHARLNFVAPTESGVDTQYMPRQA
ncbi:MAG: AAA family ATPase [Planctomycetes bacterium]|nr:AAA family ATPase [Planctomycetota bacterium]